MMFSSFRRFFAGKSHTSKSARRKAKARRPQRPSHKCLVELLETRLAPTVSITKATLGTGLIADMAADSTSGAAYTTLGNITIASGSTGDFSTFSGAKTL